MIIIMQMISGKLHDRNKVLINIITITQYYYSNNCAGAAVVIVGSFCKKSSSVRK